MNVKPDAFFGLVEIEGKACSSAEGCDEDPVAAFPYRMRPVDFERQFGREKLDEVGLQPDGSVTGVMWFCPEHAGDASRGGVPIQEIRRTCLQTVGESQCGAVATHMAILGVKGHGLQLVSVCPKHLQGHKPD